MDSVEAQLKMLMVAGMAGNGAAHRALLSAAALRLRGYFARRLGPDSADLEDLVQETLIAIHRRRASYDPVLPFTAWLHAIARYKLIDYLRRRGIRKEVPLGAAAEMAAPDRAGEWLAAADVEQLLDRLPDKQRRAIRLTRIEGRSIAEAAALTGQSRSGVKVGIHRGIRRLMEHAKGGDGHD